MPACMCICIYAHMHTCVYACVYVCMYAYMYVCTCGRVVVCVCMCVCMYACMYACMHVVKSCKSHKVQSGHVSHTRCSQVKSCESARVSAETVSGGSVVAVDVGRKDGIVAGKVGCVQRGYGLKCVRIVSPNPETREGTLLSFVVRLGQPVDRGQRVGVVRCRCVPRSPERLAGLLVVVVCVEKCGMSLMSSTCRGCGDGAR